MAGPGNATRNDAVWAAVFWTPQLLWAVLAAGLLVAVLVGFWHRALLINRKTYAFGFVNDEQDSVASEMQRRRFFNSITANP